MTATTYPGWVQEACFSCRGAGVEMPGDFIATCSTCKGSCAYWRHEASGLVCDYPGGRILFRAPSRRGSA